MPRTHYGAALALLAASCLASGDDASQMAGIGRIVRLPATGLQAVETVDGQLLFLSDNGRYAFRGAALDLWHGVRLTSFDEAQSLAGRIDLKRLKLDVRDLGAVDLGQGPEVVVFVDPFCPHCAALAQDIQALSGRYRFRLVPIPALGEPSQRAVLAINCLSATDPAQARDVLLGKVSPSDLPAPAEGCGEGASQRALIAAQILGIPGTPYLIAPDGRLRHGAPENLADWVAGTAGQGQ